MLYDANGFAIVLQKIAICKVPIAVGRYKDFCLLAVFDVKIALFLGDGDGWTILCPHQSLAYYSYSDAIMQNGLVFATTAIGIVHVWDPQQSGNFPPYITY